MAYREGILRWKGDPEFDGDNAKRFMGMMRLIAAKNPSDEEIKALLREAEDAYTSAGGEQGQGSIFFTRGVKAYGNKEWDEAIRAFRQVPQDDDLYEKAIVKVAVCRFRKGEQADALRELEDYVERYVQDRNNAVESEVRKARRKEALAEAEFFRGLGTWILATKGDGEDEHRRVVTLLASYHTDYPEQEVLAPWTLEMVVDSHLALGELGEARKNVDILVADWRDKKRTAGAIKDYYNALLRERDAAGTTDERRREILTEMASFLKVANDVGSPDFRSFRNEMRHWKDLGNFKEAVRIAERLVETFGDVGEHAADMQSRVYPDYGAILLELGRVDEAKAVLTPLVMSGGARPSKRTVLDWTRSVSGWLVGGAAGEPVREVAGAGGAPEEWQAVIDKLDAITRAGDKWVSCEWYEQKLMIVYTYYAWSRSDQRKLESAQNQMSQINIQLQDPNFDSVEGYCSGQEESEDDPETLRRLGAGVLRARFQYMARKLG